jgi:hypothetical protein
MSACSTTSPAPVPSSTSPAGSSGRSIPIVRRRRPGRCWPGHRHQIALPAQDDSPEEARTSGSRP